jgi:hypothetical protein
LETGKKNRASGGRRVSFSGTALGKRDRDPIGCGWLSPNRVRVDENWRLETLLT